MADFYLIKNEKTGKFYDGRFFSFNSTIGTSQARFASAKNANEEIKKYRTNGKDVTHLVIVPVNVVAEPEVIKPELSEQKKGFVIRFTHPGEYGKTIYWKGNKKDPQLDFLSAWNGPNAPFTASVFPTLADVNAAYNHFKDVCFPAMLKKEKASIKQRKSWGMERPDEGYLKILNSVKMDVVEVG